MLEGIHHSAVTSRRAINFVCLEILFCDNTKGTMRKNLFLLAALCLICVGRGFAADVDEKDVVVLGDKNFTDGVKNSKFALVCGCCLLDRSVCWTDLVLGSGDEGSASWNVAVLECERGNVNTCSYNHMFLNCRWNSMPHGVDTART